LEVLTLQIFLAPRFGMSLALDAIEPPLNARGTPMVLVREECNSDQLLDIAAVAPAFVEQPEDALMHRKQSA